ncbi:unnamed protein product [Amaranthus hypochondriacus]
MGKKTKAKGTTEVVVRVTGKWTMAAGEVEFGCFAGNLKTTEKVGTLGWLTGKSRWLTSEERKSGKVGWREE